MAAVMRPVVIVRRNYDDYYNMERITLDIYIYY